MDFLLRQLAALHHDGYDALFWSDVLRHDPQLAKRLPRSKTTALVWYYEAPAERSALPDWVQALLNISALTIGSGGITYSIVRYKFLDTKLLARRGILYALASAILVGFYLIVVSR